MRSSEKFISKWENYEKTRRRENLREVWIDSEKFISKWGIWEILGGVREDLKEVWMLREVYIKMRWGLRKTGRSKGGFERSLRKTGRSLERLKRRENFREVWEKIGEVKENLGRVWINFDKFISNW